VLLEFNNGAQLAFIASGMDSVCFVVPSLAALENGLGVAADNRYPSWP
jgi:hypothetical protein